MGNKINDQFFSRIDRIFSNKDKQHIQRTRNLRLIPAYKNRRGGKLSYAEWAHVIGIFQSLFYQALSKKKSGNHILDIGCGTGLLGIAAEPFTSEGGSYTGVDVIQSDIEFCKEHYRVDNYDFIHFDVANPTYTQGQSDEHKPWPLEAGKYDLVTGLSVWTHLNESDAKYYFKEISRVLKTGGKAVITFFLLDELYEKSLPQREDKEGRYHFTNQKIWIFNTPAYDSENWRTLQQVKYPEDAIGLTPAGLEQLLEESGLKQVEYYPGNWKEIPGLYFQDVLVFEKS